jgi:hypothetical protein
MPSPEEHYAEGERWLQVAETLDVPHVGSLPAIRAGVIATAHFTAAQCRVRTQVAAPVKMPDE